MARDISDGLIGVGGMVTRGYGSLELLEARVTVPIEADDLRRCAVRLRATREAEAMSPEDEMTAVEESA